MLELTEAKVNRWGRRIGIGSARLAEQDYRLVELLRAIAEHDDLGARLAFKGGTALNKLYLGGVSRLSVDLDFNVLGTKDDVQGARAALRSAVVGLFEDQDPAFVTTHDHGWALLRVTGQYQPLSGGAPEKIKVELSMAERFPVTQIVTRPLAHPGGAAVPVRTYPIDELVATKLRAWYGRRKGRDIFDLHRARPLLSNPTLVRKMALYYFYRGGIVYDPDLLHATFTAKGEKAAYRGDVSTFLRADAGFALDEALVELPAMYGFLFSVDERDAEFLLLAKHLLGKIGAKRAAAALQHKRPVARLFEGQPGVSEEALTMTKEQLAIHPGK